MTYKNNQSPIAVVGVSSILPGSLTNDESWNTITSAKNLIKEIPPSHFLVSDYFEKEPSEFSKIYCNQGAFLEDYPFDPVEFGIPPNQLSAIDTAQLFGLVAAKRLMQDTQSIVNGSVKKKDISVILGVAAGSEMIEKMSAKIQKPVWVKVLRESGIPEEQVQEICDGIINEYPDWTENTFPGLLSNVVAGLITNKLDFGGSNFVTDAACASSLAAISMAMKELQSGSADTVFTGGVDALNNIFMYMCFTKTPALSFSGDIRPFSDAADGTVLGEGVVMFALRRLEDAERDGDKIYGVLRSCGTSSDGKGKSIYAPASAGQSMAINRAYDSVEFGLADVDLIEAHGTGTRAGDAAEFNGLKLAFENDPQFDPEKKQQCALGSIKSQIGHTKSTAGAAGVFKVLQSLNHKVLPPTLKVNKPNPLMDIEESPLYLNTTKRPWIKNSDIPRRAGVSSFGFGGSNFHISVEEYQGVQSPKRVYQKNDDEKILYCLSAVDEKSLMAQVQSAIDALQQDSTDIVRRARGSQESFVSSNAFRFTCVVSSNEALTEVLKNFLNNPNDTGVNTPSVYFGKEGKPQKIALLFTGQGSQYLNMGNDLLCQFNEARIPWDISESITWNPTKGLKDVVYPIPTFTPEAALAQQKELNALHWIQPAIGTLSISHLELLKTLGLEYHATAGHSYGEVPALYAAGVFSDSKTCLEVTQQRVASMEAAIAASADGAEPAGMSAVFADGKTIQSVLDKTESGVIIANQNSPRQNVVTGFISEIETLETAFAEMNIAFKRLPVPTAFHSHLMTAGSDLFKEYLESLTINKPEVPVYANTTAVAYDQNPEGIIGTLSSQLSQSVQFESEIKNMVADGVDLFIECGPGKILSGLLNDIGSDVPMPLVISMDGGKGNSALDSFWNALASLSAQGVSLDFTALWNQFKQTDSLPDISTMSKAAIMINGSNVGVKYPPEGGAASLPKPNPPAPVIKAQDTHSAQPTPHTQRPQMNQSNISVPAPAQPREHSANQVSPESLPGNYSSEILNSVQILQRTALDAQKAFQQTLAQSHEMYLNTTQMAIQSIMGGASSAAGNTRAIQPISQPNVPAFVPQSAETASIQAMPVESTPPPAPVEPTIEAEAPIQQTSSEHFRKQLLDVVSEKTGYPKEMLDIDLDLESGLGIDSIKRVEILSALQKAVPELATADTAQLSSLNTLGEIIALFESMAPAQTQATDTPSDGGQGANTGIAFVEQLLAVVSEKTGYPEEMLDLELDLESGLGIDSIKRVEILSALQKAVPALASADTAQLASLNTLGEILKLYENQVGGTARASSGASQQTATNGDVQDFKPLLLSVVAEKTGYPEEMLDLDLDLESGLGIDSIKRVEILSALQREIPELKQQDTAQLAAMNTLGEILVFAQGGTGGAVESPDSVPSNLSETVTTGEASIARYSVEYVEKKAPGFVIPGLGSDTEIVIIPDNQGVAKSLASLLQNHYSVTIKNEPNIEDKHLINISGLNSYELGEDVKHQSIDVNRIGFETARFVGQTLFDKGGVYVSAQKTAGEHTSFLAGLNALIKTADKEWLSGSLKSINIDTDECDAATTAELIYHELMEGGSELEVFWSKDSVRFIKEAIPEEVIVNDDILLSEGDTVIVSGGLKGVTADCLVALAKKVPLQFAILGRSEFIEESSETLAITDDAQLKQQVLTQSQQEGVQLTPIELNTRIGRIYATREMQKNKKRLEDIGSKVMYVSGDITHSENVQDFCNTVKEKWGAIHGIIHGAGVLADKRIHEKTDEQFSRVFNTKVYGFENLIDATQHEPLKMISCFASVAARTGNQGQVDYAMANEVLNARCAELHIQRNATAHTCVIKSFNWGPWDGGMVSSQLKEHFNAQGIGLIPIGSGSQAFADECCSVNQANTEIVIGASMENWASSSKCPDSFSIILHSTIQPIIHDHTIQTKKVVPLALVTEWFNNAGCELLGTSVVITECSMKKGLVLPNYETSGDTFTVVVKEKTDQTAALQLVDAAGFVFYTAVAVIESNTVHGKISKNNTTNSEPWKLDTDKMYSHYLFHGKQLQVLHSLTGTSESGCEGLLTIERCHALKSGSLVPSLIDGGIQLAVLWYMNKTKKDSLPVGFKQIEYHTPVNDGLIHCDFSVSTTSEFETIGDLHFYSGDSTVLFIKGLKISASTQNIIFRKEEELF